MTESLTNYDLTLEPDAGIRLNLAYRSPEGPVNLNGWASFFQIGDTKPHPGSIEDNTISFDIKKMGNFDLNGMGYNVTIRNLESGKILTVMRGHIRTLPQ